MSWVKKLKSRIRSITGAQPVLAFVRWKMNKEKFLELLPQMQRVEVSLLLLSTTAQLEMINASLGNSDNTRETREKLLTKA